MLIETQIQDHKIYKIHTIKSYRNLINATNKAQDKKSKGHMLKESEGEGTTAQGRNNKRVGFLIKEKKSKEYF